MSRTRAKGLRLREALNHDSHEGGRKVRKGRPSGIVWKPVMGPVRVFRLFRVFVVQTSLSDLNTKRLFLP
jgi:hypothetical protein